MTQPNNQNPVQKIGNFLGSLAAALTGQNNPQPSSAPQATVTLRYGLQSKVVEATQEVLDSTVRDLFDDASEELGLPDGGSYAIRSGGETVEPTSKPSAGREYTASAARETKGN